MRPLTTRFNNAKAEQSRRLRLLITERWEAFGDPRMCVTLAEVIAYCVGRELPQKPMPFGVLVRRELEGLGAPIYNHKGTPMVRGLRLRGQSLSDALAASAGTRKWAARAGWKNGPKRGHSGPKVDGQGETERAIPAEAGHPGR